MAMMSNRAKIAVAQIFPSPGDSGHNLAGPLEYTKKAYTGEANLIAFPEMYLSGYSAMGNYGRAASLKTCL
jgi:predicted amidohydrolase